VTTHLLPRPEGERLHLTFTVAAARPTLIFLAGTGGTAVWAAEESRLPAAAAAAGFNLVVPEAQRPRPSEPAKFITNPPRWNDGSPPPTPEMATDVDDVAYLVELIDHLIDNGVADPARVTLSGFSNGAGMAFRFAAERAERLAAVAPVAGLWWPAAAQPSRPVPTLYTLGRADPLIPLHGGDVHLPWSHRLVRRPAAMRSLEAWAAALGCDTRSVIESDRDGVQEERFPGPVEFRALLIDGHGHHWPGGRGGLNPRIGGPISAKLDLNARLFDFLSRHHL